MGEIIQFISLVFAPLASPLLLVVLVAGFFFGLLYIYRLNVDNQDIFHIAMAGWVFLLTIFVFRLTTFITVGNLMSAAAGTLGISIAWGLYCLLIYLGKQAGKKSFKRK